MYSLGITLYEAVTGRRPFDGPTPHDVMRRQVSRKPREACKVNSDVSPEISAFLDWVLAKKPSDRPASWQDFINAIHILLGEED